MVYVLCKYLHLLQKFKTGTKKGKEAYAGFY